MSSDARLQDAILWAQSLEVSSGHRMRTQQRMRWKTSHPTALPRPGFWTSLPTARFVGCKKKQVLVVPVEISPQFDGDVFNVEKRHKTYDRNG